MQSYTKSIGQYTVIYLCFVHQPRSRARRVGFLLDLCTFVVFVPSSGEFARGTLHKEISLVVSINNTDECKTMGGV